MTEFILTPKNRHMSAKAILDVMQLRRQMIIAKALQNRFPSSVFLETVATSVGEHLVGTGYRYLPKPEGVRAL